MDDTQKSREELLAELHVLRQGRDSCESALSERKRMESALVERVKELDCLYGITRLAQNRERPLPEFLGGVAELICASWQFPEAACARITLGDEEYATPSFRRTRWRQAASVTVQGEAAGQIEVCYLEERPAFDEGPFLREERHLIDAVADLVGRIATQRRVEEQMRALSRELIMIQENERQRIARELHDHLTQDLSGVKAGLERLLAEHPPAEAFKPQAADVVERLSAAISSLRDLSYLLLPMGLTELGLVNTVLRHCEEYSQRHGIEVEVYADGMEGLKLDFETQINLYRIIQESLTNVRKHAAASRVVVRLLASHPHLLLRIEDDGRGASLDECLARAGRERRMGLWSMRERVRLLGGKFSFVSRPGGGVCIRVEAPLKRRKRGSQAHSDR
ncbi:MAG: sensor histidine kinase [Thermodesulfobacteriota bacterium]